MSPRLAVMTSSKLPLPPGVHVILGGSAGGIFNRNYGSKQRLIDYDVLSCGPTPKCESIAAWEAMRLEYWESLVPGSDIFGAIRSSLTEELARLRDAERIHIWAATGLSEQLFIAHVIHLADGLQVDPARVCLLQFEYLRGRHARIIGMGELNEANMAAHPEPVPLTPDLAEDYRAAWAALTSSDPTLFERFARMRPNANPWLKHAMQLMLRRFPDRKTGLVYWDRLLLEKVRDRAPHVRRAISDAMVDDWDNGDSVGDYFLFGRLLKLGDERSPKPLLTLSGDRTDMRRTEATLTPFGLEVLEGRASSYPTNPVEDWAAGVKLSSSEGSLWFNDGGRLIRSGP